MVEDNGPARSMYIIPCIFAITALHQESAFSAALESIREQFCLLVFFSIALGRGT